MMILRLNLISSYGWIFIWIQWLIIDMLYLSWYQRICIICWRISGIWIQVGENKCKTWNILQNVRTMNGLKQAINIRHRIWRKEFVRWFGALLYWYLCLGYWQGLVLSISMRILSSSKCTKIWSPMRALLFISNIIMNILCNLVIGLKVSQIHFGKILMDPNNPQPKDFSVDQAWENHQVEFRWKYCISVCAALLGRVSNNNQFW